MSDWWAHSRAYFDGNPIPTPVIQPQVNSSMDYEIPPVILQKFKAYDAMFQQQQLELQKLAEQQNKPAMHFGTSFVGDEPVGFSDFKGLPHTGHPPRGPPTDSFFGGLPVPTPPVTSTYPSPFPSTGHTANRTPMGFAAFATPIDHQAGPSYAPDIAADMRDEIERPRRDCRPSKYQQYPWTQQGPTTILPKKRGAKSKQKKSTSNIPPFNLEEEAVDEDAQEDDVTFVGSGFSEPLIIDNVDLKKVRRKQYVSFEDFLINPSKIYLDCHPRGWVADLTFFQQLVPDLYKRGTDRGVEKIGWLTDDVAMPMNPFGDHWVTVLIDLPYSKLVVLDSMHSSQRCEDKRKYVTEWTKVLNQCLEALGHFSRTRRPYYNFEFHYNDAYLIPQQGNFSDCGVITCWLIHEFVTSQWPPKVVDGDVVGYFSNVRYSMAKMFYDRRCEPTSMCGYD
ncbi:hypothetical protein CTI12_AA595960 [Artemisia annua]|uniref:Ubiquitin-like protease family profile domain-containing protein n=1 Tax=Artemisia annua TaxID=35608 RepID=A0A2U1KJB9_ARTAN|nr:hypothetical protein CTI12_AA595960 [Artemisia annua]